MSRAGNRLERRRRELHAAASKHDPVVLEGPNARYDWITAVTCSTFAPTTRHVAHALARYGRVDASRIFPSMRKLAKDTGLTLTCVCHHTEQLAREGYVRPETKRGKGGQKWARTQYVLTLPRKVYDALEAKPWEEEFDWEPEPDEEDDGSEGVPRRGTPSGRSSRPKAEGVPRRKTPRGGIREGVPRHAKGVPPDAGGVQRRYEGVPRHPEKVFNDVASSSPSGVLQGVHQGSSPTRVSTETVDRPVSSGAQKGFEQWVRGPLRFRIVDSMDNGLTDEQISVDLGAPLEAVQAVRLDWRPINWGRQ